MNKAATTAAQQLAKAGFRLVSLLNAIWPSSAVLAIASARAGSLTMLMQGFSELENKSPRCGWLESKLIRCKGLFSYREPDISWKKTQK
jgi:hypothetical protein